MKYGHEVLEEAIQSQKSCGYKHVLANFPRCITNTCISRNSKKTLALLGFARPQEKQAHGSKKS